MLDSPTITMSMDGTPKNITNQLGAALYHQIQQAGQCSILRFWDQLTQSEQESFARQLAKIDWDFVKTARPRDAVTNRIDPQKRQSVRPVRCCVPADGHSEAELVVPRGAGQQLLAGGKVAVILVAGGQATRLGVSHPKGTFPIGPVSGASFYQRFAEQVVALNRRYQTSIPYLVMTSDSTHDASVEWFANHNNFGLNPDDLHFFRQGSAPAFHLDSGELIMSSRSSLALNPDGHGGLLQAMKRAGLFERLKERGIETLFYHQVDNPLVKVCDPVFLGQHAIQGADISTRVIRKHSPEEKVGVIAEVEGLCQIIEYSDLPAELAELRDDRGQLTFWAGNTAIHLFQRQFLEEVSESEQLPWHHLVRPCPYVDLEGGLIQPTWKNAVKFERFIFDILPLAKVSLVVEADRDHEFSPLKNAEGSNSPDQVKADLIRVAAALLRESGIDVAPGTPVEVSPLVTTSDLPLIPLETCPSSVNEPTLFDDRYLAPPPIYVSPNL